MMRDMEDLLDLIFRGFDDGDEDPPPSGEEENDDDTDDEDPPGGDPTGGDDDGDDGEDEEDDGADNEKLLKALRNERKARKQHEKELRQLRLDAKKRADAEKSDLEKAQDELAEEKAAREKLEQRLRTNAVRDAITKAARKAKFRDEDDAVSLIDIDDEWIDEDLEVDTEAVSKAVKQLAKVKPHLVLAEGSEEPSGSKFGGKKKETKGADEKALKEKYPGLGGGSGPVLA